MQHILYWLFWNTFTQKLSRCIAVPSLHFIFPYSVVILTWQRQQRANSQKIICVSSCQKNLHILPLISISFVLNWSLCSFAGSCSVLIIPTAPRVFTEALSLNGVGFTSALLKWNTFTGDGSQTESNLLLKKRNTFWLVKERVRETEREREQITAKIKYVEVWLDTARFGFVQCLWNNCEYFSALTCLI